MVYFIVYVVFKVLIFIVYVVLKYCLCGSWRGFWWDNGGGGG